MTSAPLLSEGYEIRELSDDEFTSYWDAHAEKIFDDDSQIFRVFDFLTEQEKAKVRVLRSLMGTPYQLRLGLFHHDQFAGWSAGHQESSETYYMRNSAILPAHRRKGLYSALLKQTLETVIAKGFQKIYSRHNATNNPVIIPKLRAGFSISSLEVSDMFGVLVHLTYFPSALRRKVMVYRVGDMKPDDEIRKCMKLENK
jgi:GNAT superfamily N-acetyltransferase